MTPFSAIFLKNVLVKDLAAFFSKYFFADSAVAQAESEDQVKYFLDLDRPTGKIAEKWELFLGELWRKPLSNHSKENSQQISFIFL